jgi:hypothetical protein
MAMDTDTDLTTAVHLGCALAIVRVRTAAAEKAGTRSATAVYEVDVLRNGDPALPEGVVLKQFGLPTLEPGRLYAVAARNSARFHGGWQLCFAAFAASDDPDQALLLLRERIARLAPP